VLDIFVRTGMNKSSELVPQLELLKKISDTLGVLGLGELRSDIDGEIDRLKSVVERGGVSNDNVVLDIASTLLRVEDRLDQQLIRLTVPQDAPAPVETDMSPQDAADYQQVAESVMRECIINLARIKETIGQSIASQAPSQGLDSVPSLVRGIRAGLLMLNKTRAMDVMERIGKLIVLTLQGGGPSRLTQKETDRLADAIVSIEYYMETVKAGRADPWYMLDNAEACLTVLRDVGQRLEQDAASEVPETTQKIPRADVEAHAVEQEAAGVPQATAVMPLPVVASDAEHLDPELQSAGMERRARRHGSADNRAALFPHPEGQRTHGRCGTYRRVLLGRRKPAQQTNQPHAGSHTADGGLHTGGRRRRSGVDRATGGRYRARQRHKPVGGTRARFRRRRPQCSRAHNRKAGARRRRGTAGTGNGSGASRYFREGNRRASQGHCRLPEGLRRTSAAIRSY
jgi:chemosensory pili system protein ChpA (sensor histidine kinase/response regulator)